MRVCFGMITGLVATSMLAACTGGAASPEPLSGTSVQPRDGLSCSSAIKVAPLPVWARSGFDPPDQEVRQVRGLHGQILGVVFADPLRAPPVKGYGNKILWLVPPGAPGTADPVDSGTSAALQIEATLNGTGLTVRRTVPGGPGPSIVDMPQAGCWTLHLAWARHRDTLVLPYRGETPAVP